MKTSVLLTAFGLLCLVMPLTPASLSASTAAACDLDAGAEGCVPLDAEDTFPLGASSTTSAANCGVYFRHDPTTFEPAHESWTTDRTPLIKVRFRDDGAHCGGGVTMTLDDLATPPGDQVTVPATITADANGHVVEYQVTSDLAFTYWQVVVQAYEASSDVVAWNFHVVPVTDCTDGADNDNDGAKDYPADTGCTGTADASERGTISCDDGADNDIDGLADYPDDPGCTGIADATEWGTAQCDDGFDNDGDGRIDNAADPGCTSLTDANERGTAVCDDGQDNDGDLFADYPNDPGCFDIDDASERGSHACDDGIDNDGDLHADYPNDPGCLGPTDGDERGTADCDDAMDNDGDQVSDYPADPGCVGPGDTSERGNIACDDGDDNDGDAGADYPADAGCTGPGDDSERGSVACDDGNDNDGDGRTDYPSDIGCASATDPTESCSPLLSGVVACLDATTRETGPLYMYERGLGDAHTLVGYVDIYIFELAGDIAVSLACVRLVLDGQDDDLCAAAGGTYSSTFREIHNRPLYEPDLVPTQAFYVCNAELTATVLGMGVQSAPAYTLC